MKRYLLFIILSFAAQIPFYGIENRKLTFEEAEALFLQQNLQLIASHYNIDIADALITQAKLWDNPTLSLNQVNLWSTDAQREGIDEVIPPLFGSFGKNTQFSVELTQLIQTAGKRSKLIKRERVSKEIAICEFEEVLRGLKTELRNTINELVYLQSYQQILYTQEESLSRQIQSYRKQMTLGNIARNELLRLESSLLELEQEWFEVEVQLHEQQCILKSLLNLSTLDNVEIETTNINYINPEEYDLASLIDTALIYRPDINLVKLQTEYHDRSMAYEKAQRVPDIEVGINYDRFGGVWKDFVGFGIAIDLPVINRNQGNIKMAKIEKEQSQQLAAFQQNLVEHEVVEVFQNYRLAYNFYQKVNNNSLLQELDEMLEIHSKNFAGRNISILEYLDFIEAYKNNKQTMLNAKRNLDVLFEELQFTIGTEIK